jgi:hypothetical protein
MKDDNDYLFLLNQAVGLDSYDSFNTQIAFMPFVLRFGPPIDLGSGLYDYRAASDVVGVYLLNKPEGVVNSPSFGGKHVSLEDAVKQASKCVKHSRK